MTPFFLVFESIAKSPYARVVEFKVQVFAQNEKDANLIGQRMSGEPSWAFVRVEAP